MGSYFHLCKTKLGAGSIIEPGNFGEVIQIYGYKHTAFQREMIVEEVRRGVAPTATSRLQCLFVFSTIEDARIFQMREFTSFGTDYLYEVQPITACQPTYGQVGALENWPQGEHVTRATLYWNKTESAVNGAVIAPPAMGVWAGFQEVLLNCPVRVINRLGRLIA